MTRLAVLVEGRTEFEFVRNVLSEHLSSRGVYPYPISLDGNVNTERLVPRMVNLSHNFDSVTSLVDFYGFRDKGAASPDELERRIDREVDIRLHLESNPSMVFSYVQVHEFEGLLFSNVNAFADLVDARESPLVLDELQSIRAQFQTPEDINDSVDTAPSKRITKMIPGYNKVVDGAMLAESIGLDTIRAECPRFDEWLTRLESLGSTPMAE